MNADFLKLAPGDLVRIIMPGHRYRGRVGTVSVVLEQGEVFQDRVPPAVLVELRNGFQDWFFGESHELEIVDG